jgi:hypothetical protein
MPRPTRATIDALLDLLDTASLAELVRVIEGILLRQSTRKAA